MSIPHYVILSDSEDEFEHSSTVLGSPTTPFHSDDSDHDMETQDQPSSEEPKEGDPSEEEGQDDTPVISSPQTPPFYYRRNLNGARTVTTARKSVRLPQEGPIPTFATTTTPAAATTTPTATPRRRSDARRWSWMPATLQAWGEQEGSPNIQEIGESSNSQHRLPVPRDPVTALLVARLERQEREHRSLLYEFEHYVTQNDTAVQGHVNGIREDAHLTEQALGAVHTQLNDAQSDIALLRYRVEQSERHASELARQMAVLEERIGRASAYASVMRSDPYRI